MNIYDFKVEDIYGSEVSLEEYRGQVVLVLNSATECGFTSQYDKLQDLYETYANEGFVILDFPCNQFGHQATGTGEEIMRFCDSRYGITFPIFSKIEVNGENASPLFMYLKEQQGFKGFDLEEEQGAMIHQRLQQIDADYAAKSDIKWNFTKFLVDREGNVVTRFEPIDDMYDVEEAIRELI